MKLFQSCYSHSSGFAMIAVLFVLILLALWGTKLLNIGVANQSLISLKLIETRANYATKSAIALANFRWQNSAHCAREKMHWEEFEIEIECQKLNNIGVNENTQAIAVFAVTTTIPKENEWLFQKRSITLIDKKS